MSNFTFTETKIKGVYIIDVKTYGDHRGYGNGDEALRLYGSTSGISEMFWSLFGLINDYTHLYEGNKGNDLFYEVKLSHGK